MGADAGGDGQVERIRLDELVIDPEYQPRAELDAGWVKHLAGILEDDAEHDLEPIDVFAIDNRLLLVSGWHRLAAYKNADRLTVPVRIHENKDRDAAAIFAASSNARHGKPLSPADRRKAVTMILSTPQGWELGDREIARRTGSTHPTVGTIRQELKRVVNLPPDESPSPGAPVDQGDAYEPPGDEPDTSFAFGANEATDRPVEVVETVSTTRETAGPGAVGTQSPSAGQKPAKASPSPGSGTTALVYDRFGVKVPSGVRDLAADQNLRDLVEHLSIALDLTRTVQRLNPHLPWANIARVETLLNDAKDAAFYCVCKPCRGEGCGGCSMTGYRPLGEKDEIAAGRW